MSFEKKLRQIRKNWSKGMYRGIVRTVSLCVATACVTALASYYLQGRNAEQSIDALRNLRQQEQDANGESRTDDALAGDREILSGLQELANQNADLIGWLTIDGTSVDYPVMWTPEDPEYYSRRGFDKKASRNGLLFLDEESNVNEYGGNLIIYGHNMKNGSMFADLINYEDASYYEAHPTIRLDTLYESRLYEIAYVMKSADMDDLPFSFTSAVREDAQTALANAEFASLYDTGVTASYGDDFLTLATCDYSKKDGRLVLLAKRIQ